MKISHFDAVLSALGRVADREEQRAYAEFAAKRGRPYNGASDADWDQLDHDYVAVGLAIDIWRQHGPKASA